MFEYLAGTIVYIIALYFVIVIATIVIYYFRSVRNSVGTEEESSEVNKFIISFFHGKPFEATYQSGLVVGTNGCYVLLAIRLCALFFFLAIPFLWGYIREDGGGAHYFTTWNIDLITLYFFLASICSVFGIAYGPSNPVSDSLPVTSSLNHTSVWSSHVINFGYAVQILFEVTGGTAFFVTVIDFAALDHKFGFWNVVQHFITSLMMLMELLVNHIPVRPEHFSINLTWALCYLIFIWPVVASHVLSDWPYFFLATYSSGSFGWYTVLYIVDIIFYFVFWLVARGRDWLVGLESSTELSLRQNEDVAVGL